MSDITVCTALYSTALPVSSSSYSKALSAWQGKPAYEDSVLSERPTWLRSWLGAFMGCIYQKLSPKTPWEEQTLAPPVWIRNS